MEWGWGEDEREPRDREDQAATPEAYIPIWKPTVNKTPEGEQPHLGRLMGLLTRKKPS